MARMRDANADDHLSELPDNPRERSLWMQHGVGYLLMRDIREAMHKEIERDVEPKYRQVAQSVVDDTIYRMCMLVEGIGPPLKNGSHTLSVDLVGRLIENATGEVLAEQSMRDGDGITVGFHGWIEGEFGEGNVRPLAGTTGD